LTLLREEPDIYLGCDSDDTFTLEVSLSLTHTHLAQSLDSANVSLNPVIKGSYFFGVSDSIPTNFLVVPPRLSGKGRTPILALHGAGVDIFSPPMKSLWTQALPRQDRSWVVIPSGRTSWGLDWHGPSAQDAWGALDAVTDILQNSKSTTWGGGKWGIPVAQGLKGKAQAIVMGHSNGGQGTWAIAERSPDRVVGIIPASAYIKSQSYVPWTMSRSAHFADPFLEAILQTSLTPDDNDLFLGNLHGKDVLAIHGGDDENVPVWHSRELVSVLESLCGSESNTSRIEYQEIPGQPHWFPSVLNNDRVQSFIDQLLDKVELDSSQVTDYNVKPEHFKLTVAVPAEVSSMRGFHVEKLAAPGRLGRISVDVRKGTHSNSSAARVTVETTNVLEFSVNPNLFGALGRDAEFWIDGDKMHLHVNPVEEGKMIYFKAMEQKVWKLNSVPNTLQLSGRMQTILSSDRPAPIVFIVPDPALDPESRPSWTTSHAMSVALRLAHDLLLYHRLDSEIILNSEVNFGPESASASVLGRGNIVVVGNQAAFGLQNVLNDKIEEQVAFNRKRSFIGVEEFLTKVHIVTRKNSFSPDGPELQPGQGVLFLHPHPLNSHAKMLLLQSTDTLGIGLERAARLFPIRTGIPVPDWIIVGGDGGKGEGNVVSAGVWDSEWNWNEAMSWSSAS